MTGGLIDDEQGGAFSDLHTKADGQERMKKNIVYVGFIDLDKMYDTVNREVLWQVMRMYDVEGKLMCGIKSKYVDSLACVRVQGG